MCVCVCVCVCIYIYIYIASIKWNKGSIMEEFIISGKIFSFQQASVQFSHLVVSDSATPWTAAR